MIENARGAAPFHRGWRAGLDGKSKRDNPYDQPGRQTQSGLDWERKCSEWYEGWSADNSELSEHQKSTPSGSRKATMTADEAKQKSVLKELGYTEEQIEALGNLASNPHQVFSGVVGSLPVSKEFQDLLKPVNAKGTNR